RQGIDSKESLEAVILARVKSELDLTPEQAGKFVENFYKAEEVKKEYTKKKIGALQELKKALDSEKLDEGALNSLVEDCSRLDREQMERVKEAKDRNMSMLTVKQKAKLVIMESRMQGALNPHMRKMMKDENRSDKKERREERKQGPK
ncbi:MAG: Spy/CpxP family protein refolding chaperone, partial [Candidatus Firestonebacteria bacterium]